MKEKRVDLKRLEDAEKEAAAIESLDNMQRLHHDVLVAKGVASKQRKLSIADKTQKLEKLKALLLQKAEKQQTLIDCAERSNAPPALYNALQAEFDAFHTGQSFLDRRFSNQADRIIHLESEVALLQSQLKTRDDQLVALKSQVKSTETETTSRNANVDALKHEVRSLEDGTKLLEGQIHTLKNQAVNHAEVEYSLRKDKDSAEERAIRLKAEVDDLQSQLQPLRQEKVKFESELEAQLESNQSLRIESSSTMSELLEKRSQVIELEASIKAKDLLVEEKTQSHGALEKKIMGQKQRYQDLQEQFDSKSEEAAAAAQNLAAETAEKENLSQQHDRIKQEQEELSKKLEQKDQEITSLTDKLHGEGTRLEQKGQEITSLTGKLNAETFEKAKLQEQHDQNKKAHEQLQARLTQSDRKVEKLTRDLDAETTNHANLRKERDEARAGRDGLQAQFNESNKKVASLTDTLALEETAKSDLRTQYDEVNRDYTGLKAQIAHKDQELTSLRDGLADFKRKAAEEATAAKQASEKAAKELEVARQDADGFATISQHLCQQVAPLVGLCEADVKLCKLDDGDEDDYLLGFVQKALPMLQTLANEKERIASELEKLHSSLAEQVTRDKDSVLVDVERLNEVTHLLNEDDD